MKKAIISLIAASMLLSNAVAPVYAEDAPDGTAGEIQAAETAAEQTETTAEEETDSEPEEVKTAENEINIYVSSKNRGGDGSLENPYSDLENAIAQARGIDKTKNKAVINIMGGIYELNNTISLSKNDSGTAENPLTIRAYNNEDVRFMGSKSISGGSAELVKDTATLNRIPTAARGKVYKLDLTALKITNAKELTYCDVVYDNEIMPIAKYPNIGSDYAANAMGNQSFQFESGKNTASWANAKDAIVRVIAGGGYELRDMKFKSVTNGSVYVEDTYANLADGARIRVMNLLEELDSPGEWYLDKANNFLYFYPPDETFKKEMRFLTMDGSMISVKEASNITIEGLTFENTKNIGATVDNSRNIIIDNCTFRNIGFRGIYVNDSNYVTVQNTTVCNVGTECMRFRGGGNMDKYQYSGNTVKNCDLYNAGLSDIIQGRGIMLGDDLGYATFGLYVQNNRFHNITHQAMLTSQCGGLIFENNEIYNCVNDTYDAGAVYANGTYRVMGNVYRNNFFHDINVTSDSKGGATVALYWDDGSSMQTATGNIFANNDLSLLSGGGDDNVVENSVFYKSRSTVSYDNRGENWARGMYNVVKPTGKFLDLITWPNAEWSAKYPYLDTLYEYYSTLDELAVRRPENARVENNVLIDSGKFNLSQSVQNYAKSIKNNTMAADRDNIIDFKDPANYDFSFTENAKIFSENSEFKMIDFDSMGLTTAPKSAKAELISPCDGATNVQGNDMVLRWKNCGGYDKYRLEISRNEDFTEMVYDEIVKGTCIALDNMKYNKTFWWRVTPVKGSKAESNEHEPSAAFKFTTAKTETVSTTELSALINKLGTGWRHAKEGNKPGTYKPGSIEMLSNAVNEAEEVLYNPTAKMFTIKSVTAKLNEAINKFNENYNYQVVDLGDWIADKNAWSFKANKHENNLVNVNMDVTGDAFVYTGAQLTANQCLKFKTNLDFTNYEAFALNQGAADQVFWATTGYSIVIKRNIFEVQKRYYNTNGAFIGGIVKTYLNEESIMTSDRWYDVEMGLLSSPMGPRILMKIDGKTVIDWVDTSDTPINERGYFGLQDASGNAGLTLAGANYETNQED